MLGGSLFVKKMSIKMGPTLIGGSESYFIGLKPAYCLKFWEFIPRNTQKIILPKVPLNFEKLEKVEF